jgi:hypothetical protein
MLLEPLRNFRMFCSFTPFAFFQLGRRGDWENYAQAAGFQKIEFHGERGIGIFVLEK